MEWQIITGDIDIALISLYLFWAFFAGLIIYLQRENMREGYPLEADDGDSSGNQGPYPLPRQKTFKMPFGRDDITVPNNHPVDDRPLALEQMPASAGSPFEPTGDPMVDGVGPASWCMRRDVPELDGHGHVKIKPMAGLADFSVVWGRDCRGMPMVSHDRQVVGTVTDVWVDVPEQLVRYVEFEMSDGSGKRLAPIHLVKIKRGKVKVQALYAKHFANIPQHKASDQVTLLEEEKICAYYCGGKLYADPRRLDPQI